MNQGWRYFKCNECGAHWRETCRDHQTDSRSKCITESCKINSYGGENPYKNINDKTIKVDKFGNLIGKIIVERLNE